MFDEILQMVKEHFGNHPEISALPAEQQDAIHQEIANHVSNTLANQSATTAMTSETVNPVNNLSSSGGIGSGLLGKLENAVASGGTVTNAIEGGLIGSLASKFGLPPSIAGAISGALPGLLQKFAGKAKSTAS
jgi:uncharacterized protein YidB (DUF937 family)